MKPEITRKEISLSHNEARKLFKKHHRNLKPNEIVHHKDLNPLNNSLDNLQAIDKAEHLKLHGKLGRDRPYILKTDSGRVTIEVPLDLLKKIEGQARDNERDVSKEIRFIIKKHFEGKRR